jgi:CheY-like chemotaxis protein
MPTTHALSVLIVEDNPDGAETLAALVDLFGYDARAAQTGDDAVRMALESPPDVVLLDIGLPGMDGCAVAEKLRELLSRRPLLVAVTGYANLNEQCCRAGIDHYFVKPLEPRVLEDLLRLHAEKLVKQHV